MLTIACLLSLFATVSLAQPYGPVVKASKKIPGTSLEYRQINLCETTPKVASYSGYVHLPSSLLSQYSTTPEFNISSFFLYFSARKNPANAPLVLYLAGGPGESSTAAALLGNGPCIAQADANSTIANPNSFNEFANVLYVDQPNMVGFSYDEIVDGMLDLSTGVIDTDGTGSEDGSWIKGKFPTQMPERVPISSIGAAEAMYLFLEVWLDTFDAHKGSNTLSIFSNSYGGVYSTALAAYIHSQNDKIGVAETFERVHINVDTVAVTNGFLDLAAQASSLASFPCNNTYNYPSGLPVQLYSKELYNEVMSQTGPCTSLVRMCQQLGAQLDPLFNGNVETVNIACQKASNACMSIQATFLGIGVSPYDIAMPLNNPLPPTWGAAFLDQDWVKETLGIPNGLNFTLNSNTVYQAAISSNDPFRWEGIKEIGKLLERGTKVTLINGDRDWRCSWVGVEEVAVQIPSSSNKSISLSNAGYTPFKLASSLSVPALSRQNSLLSFTRVFRSGHNPSFYNPRLISTIMQRALAKKDIPTGTMKMQDYVSKGDTSSWEWRDVLEAGGQLVDGAWQMNEKKEAKRYAIRKHS